MARGIAPSASRVALAGVLFATHLGCGDPLAAPPAREPPQVNVEPSVEGRALPAARLRVRAKEWPALAPAELFLFEGELSDSQVRDVRRGTLPRTVSEREVPALAWSEPESGEIVVAPSRFLEPGGRITLVSKTLGRLAVIDIVSGNVTPRLARVWPEAGEAGAGYVLLCGASAPRSAWSLVLEPPLAEATLESAFRVEAGGACSAVRPKGLSPGDIAVLPPEVDAHLLDPAPLVASTPVEPREAECGADQLAFGPACARAEDDRLVITDAPEPLLFRVERGGAEAVFVLGPGEGHVLFGLLPGAEQDVRGLAVTRSGVVRPIAVSVRTLPARPRWILNEVLANPLGPEPKEEWIELVNAGSLEGSTLGLVLEDAAGASVLPELVLGPGESALLVREDFEGGLGGDVPPAPGVPLVRLSALGGNGLSNSGERVRLLDATGSVHSAFPSIPSRRAGVSVARRALDARDDDPDAFGEHAEPGASPGTPNTVR